MDHRHRPRQHDDVRLRRKPWPAAEERSRDLAVTPGGITPPAGVEPGWDWTPPGGLHVGETDLPWWVEVWRRVPLLDRCAHVWMWHHGGFTLPPSPPPGAGGDPAGDREPRSPLGPGPSLARVRHPHDEAAPPR